MREVVTSLVWAGSKYHLDRTLRWHDHLRAFYDGDIVLLENGSNPEDVRALSYGLGGDAHISIVRALKNYPRGTNNDYPYYWRWVYFFQTLFDVFEYDKVLAIDNDFFMLSDRMKDWAFGVDSGWSSVWDSTHNWPEPAFQIVTRCRAYLDFVNEKPFIERNNSPEAMERELPFTFVQKAFHGGRFSERGLPSIPDGADYAANVLLKDYPNVVGFSAT